MRLKSIKEKSIANIENTLFKSIKDRFEPNLASKLFQQSRLKVPTCA